MNLVFFLEDEEAHDAKNELLSVVFVLLAIRLIPEFNGMLKRFKREGKWSTRTFVQHQQELFRQIKDHPKAIFYLNMVDELDAAMILFVNGDYGEVGEHLHKVDDYIELLHEGRV